MKRIRGILVTTALVATAIGIIIGHYDERIVKRQVQGKVKSSRYFISKSGGHYTEYELIILGWGQVKVKRFGVPTVSNGSTVSGVIMKRRLSGIESFELRDGV